MLRASSASGLIEHRTHRSPIDTGAGGAPVISGFGYFSLLAFWMGGAGQ